MCFFSLDPSKIKQINSKSNGANIKKKKKHLTSITQNHTKNKCTCTECQDASRLNKQTKNYKNKHKNWKFS